MKIFFVPAFLLLFNFSSIAQPYKTGIGARVGLFSGLSLKFVSADHKGRASFDKAIEIQALMQYGGYGVVGLFELQYQAFHNVFFFFGGGIHGGGYKGEEYYNDFRTDYKHNNFNSYYKYDNKTVYSVGFSGIVGVEVKLGKLPITLGADFRPHVAVYNQGPSFLDAGGTVRYVF